MHSGWWSAIDPVRQTFVLFVDLLKLSRLRINSLSSFNWYCSSSARAARSCLTVDDARGHGSFDATTDNVRHFLEQRGFIGIAIKQEFLVSGLVSN